ncbi:MAG TPA: ORF6N domain-containing protein [Bacteroidia bacterium]|jgi:hypothetical protein|nr:ORF6N domain-containing protein [Bacteroidia bacterium]
MKTNLIEQKVIGKIYLIRGKKVMMDRDLADLYGVLTKILNQAVKRNADRFPEDFMFQLTKVELENWKSQIVTSNSEKMGLRKLPFVFTEQGVAMLSSVLNSKTAIQVNIQIIRVFTKIREFLSTNTEILMKLEKLEKKLLNHGEKINKNEAEIQIVFKALKQLLEKPKIPMKKIGFKE